MLTAMVLLGLLLIYKWAMVLVWLYLISLKICVRGYQGRIVMMQGFASLSELRLCVDLKLTTMVHHPYQVQLIADSVLSRPLDCWFKVNTGMCRLGF